MVQSKKLLVGGVRQVPRQLCLGPIQVAAPSSPWRLLSKEGFFDITVGDDDVHLNRQQLASVLLSFDDINENARITVPNTPNIVNNDESCGSSRVEQQQHEIQQNRVSDVVPFDDDAKVPRTKPRLQSSRGDNLVTSTDSIISTTRTNMVTKSSIGIINKSIEAPTELNDADGIIVVSHSRRRNRCMECPACLRPACGKCDSCIQKKEFGRYHDTGKHKSRGPCSQRRCHVLYHPDPLQEKQYQQQYQQRMRSDTTMKNDKFVISSPSSAINENLVADDSDLYLASSVTRKKEMISMKTRKGMPPKSALTEIAESSSYYNNKKICQIRQITDFIESNNQGKQSSSGSLVRDDCDYLYVYGNQIPAEPSIIGIDDDYGGISCCAAGTMCQVSKAAEERWNNAMTRKSASPVTSASIPDMTTTAESVDLKNSVDEGDESNNLYVDDNFEDDDHNFSNPMLIQCSNPDCRRQYHLGCGSPPLTEMPSSGDMWLCQDCCPHNTTSALIQYLEAADEARAAFVFKKQKNYQRRLQSRSKNRKKRIKVDDAAFAASFLMPSASSSSLYSSYVMRLLRNDCIENYSGEDHDFDKSVGVGNSATLPISELHRSTRTNVLALSDPEEFNKPGIIIDPPFFEPLPIDDFLGKPVRVYNAICNQYHTGRIVDWRVPVASLEKQMTDLIQYTYADVEFLIRFAAGKDDRKAPYYHWLFLEEHCLAVGLSVVWARMQKFTNTSWKPVILWYRTARELIPIQDTLDPDKGEIFFHKCRRGDAGNSGLEMESSWKEQAVKVKKRAKRKAWVMARTFGREEYEFLDVKQNAIDFKNPDAIKTHKTKESIFQFEVAESELAEQERIRRWHSMKQVNPMGSYVVRSRDWYSLPPLIPLGTIKDRNDHFPDSNMAEKPRHASLCPNIRLGLDRSLILRQVLKQQGKRLPYAEPTKDAASSLVCNFMQRQAKQATHVSKQRDDDDKLDLDYPC